MELQRCRVWTERVAPFVESFEAVALPLVLPRIYKRGFDILV